MPSTFRTPHSSFGIPTSPLGPIGATATAKLSGGDYSSAGALGRRYCYPVFASASVSVSESGSSLPARYPPGSSRTEYPGRPSLVSIATIRSSSALALPFSSCPFRYRFRYRPRFAPANAAKSPVIPIPYQVPDRNDGLCASAITLALMPPAPCAVRLTPPLPSPPHKARRV
jgi:hypothetical protein